ncbi:hypothetical protein ACVWZX_004652 [Deinococcus sp. UYEF24]
MRTVVRLLEMKSVTVQDVMRVADHTLYAAQTRAVTGWN